MLALLSLVFAADPLHDCATTLFGLAQPKAQEEILGWGEVQLSLDEREARLTPGDFGRTAMVIDGGCRRSRVMLIASAKETEYEPLHDGCRGRGNRRLMTKL